VGITSALAALEQLTERQHAALFALWEHTFADAVEAVLDSVQTVQASALLAFTTATAQAAIREVPQLVWSAALGSMWQAAAEAALEPALLVLVGTRAIHWTTVWDAAATILALARFVRRAAPVITTSVVKGAAKELAWHAPRHQQGITQVVAREPALESLLHAPSAVAGSSTLTAAARAVARAQHAQPAQ